MYDYTREYDHVLTYEVDGHVATITLDCPQNWNRISEQYVDELTAALEKASWDTEVRAVILTGVGPVTFGAGALSVIKSKLAHDLVSARQVMTEIGAMVKLLYSMPKPVIGVAEGACMGCLLYTSPSPRD